MIPLLARLNLCPPGIKRIDGRWSLLKITDDANYADFLGQHAKAIAQEENQKKQCENIWSKIPSTGIGKYLVSRHPNIQFIDFSEYCGLILITHIQAINIEKKYWIGMESAGSSHFNKAEARNRTICEVLERTFFSELNLSLSKIWGSAIAPSEELARFYAEEECLERWITYQAWINKTGFKLIRFIYTDINSLDLQSIIFEWEKYKGKIEIFKADNPYNLNVILVKIDIMIDNKRWIFFSNGIGKNFSDGLKKALLESIQFIPGKNQNDIEKLALPNRVREWQECDFWFEQQNINYQDTNSDHQEAYIKHIHEIIKTINGETIIYTNLECPNIYLGYVNLAAKYHWSEHKGIPIA